MKFQCTHCSQILEVGNEWAGREVPCPVCEETLQVPTRTVSHPKFARGLSGDASTVARTSRSRVGEPPNAPGGTNIFWIAAVIALISGVFLFRRELAVPMGGR